MCNVSGISSRSHLVNTCREKSFLPLHIATYGDFFLSSYYKKLQVFADTSAKAKYSSDHVPTFKMYFYLAAYSLSQVFCHNKPKQRLFLLLKIFNGFCVPSVSRNVRGLYPRS